MAEHVSIIDSLVVFKNSQGEESRGTLMHLTRNLVVFEVYNPYSIVQLSEMLEYLHILRGERLVYRGRAVVYNLVTTGIMLIVSATLLDPWSDLARLAPGDGLIEEVESFVKDWELTYNLRPSYQLAVSNISSFLAELTRWLEQVEVALLSDEQALSPEQQYECLMEIQPPIIPKIKELFTVFEKEAEEVPPDEIMAHKAFTHRELHPLTLCAPFFHRTFTKPLGYAGDYEMVNMLVRNPWEGANTYAKILNGFILNLDAGKAHRNRIRILTEYLKKMAKEMKEKENRQLRVLNVGCGPAHEVANFIKEDELSENCALYMMDFNAETISYVTEKLTSVSRSANRRPEMFFIHKSIHELLKEASRRKSVSDKTFDFVYCAGLFDYLGDRVCKRIIRLFCDWLNPGGVVLATNVHSSNSSRNLMRHLLEWYLNERDEACFQAFVPEGRGLQARVFAEETGANIFLEIRKEEIKREG